MQIYFRQGMNNPLIHPQVQTDENACVEQRAYIIICYGSALSTFIPIPFQKRDRQDD